ncbi:tetratricopeptide repeat protein [Streptomyces sp. NBC_00572]|uniref:tetratricopeptide repeat protein n=1 Tax=Streptomyces sp. NBC_00572 TaxID=2903664 RepID=UPI00224FCEBF|nr:tetratricopeptide repeat protein [Streptomyces sp. NBC_00572]MCX4983100.1 tetratricopeptide repeat protein [Streptomyces sp. NBC_00572]
MRDSHRAEAERLWERAVEEELRSSGSRVRAETLLARGRTALDSMAARAGKEYAAYLSAVERAEAGTVTGAAGRGSAANRAAGPALAGPALIAGVAAVAAVGADLALGTTTGTALGAGAAVAVASAAATVLRAGPGRAGRAGRAAPAAPDARGPAGPVGAAAAGAGAGQDGAVEAARERWLTALEVRGMRPFLERERVSLAGAIGEVRPGLDAWQPPEEDAGAGAGGGEWSDGGSERVPLPDGEEERPSSAGRRGGRGSLAGGSGEAGPLGDGSVEGVSSGGEGGPAIRRDPRAVPPRVERLRGADRSAAARRRAVLERSFGHLPDPGGDFAGRREELARITRWVQTGRASAATRPTVVMLHGEPGSGRTALAVRAAHALRDQFRGACVVDLRGDASGERPLATREALLHLLNRLGAPRERLLFREGATADQQVRRLTELYRRQLTGVPVTVVLDDAVDADQVRALLPERSDSLILVTCREPLDLGADVPVHVLPVAALDAAGAEELLRAAAGAPAPGPYDAEASDRIRELCGGLPLALRAAGSSLGGRSMDDLAQLLARPGRGDAPVERALSVRYFTDLDEDARRLLRRLSLAGRASLGAAAAAALLGGSGAEGARLLRELARAGLLDHVRGERYRLHDAVRGFAAARLLDEEDAAEIAAAQERLIRSYAELADAVIRMVDGKMSTRADRFDGHGFGSLEAALSWLDEESSFITAALRHAEGVDQQTVLDLLGALCDYCLLRGDLYRLGEINVLAESVGQGQLSRSVQWRTGIAARQLGELDKARTTLTSVVSLYQEAHQDAGAALALCSLGITLHHQGRLAEATARLREALALQGPEALAADRGWTLHALAAVERDRGNLAEATALLDRSLALHREHESPHGQAWAHFQRGQVLLLRGDLPGAEAELRDALDGYGRIHDGRGEAWALTQLARARLAAGDEEPAVEGLRGALARHREQEDARGEAWTLYHLGHALEERGDRDDAVRELGRARTMFSRMRDVYGLASARHHSGRVTRDQLAARTGGLRNSGFARQLLVDARADFHRIGVPHGEAWTCLELAIIDAGNTRVPQALGLCDEARALFGTYGDLRGADWARFLRCTLLPHAVPGSPEPRTVTAREELAALIGDRHPARDPRLDDCAEAYAVLLDRGVHPSTPWQAWDLGMVPNRHAREVLGVPVE